MLEGRDVSDEQEGVEVRGRGRSNLGTGTPMPSVELIVMVVMVFGDDVPSCALKVSGRILLIE